MVNIYTLLRGNHNIDISVIKLKDAIDVIADIMYGNLEYVKQYKDIHDILVNTDCKYTKYFVVSKIIINLSYYDEQIINAFQYELLKLFIEDKTTYKLCFDTCLLHQWILMNLYIRLHVYDKDIKHMIYKTTVHHYNKLDKCRTENKLTDKESKTLTSFMLNIINKIHNYLISDF